MKNFLLKRIFLCLIMIQIGVGVQAQTDLTKVLEATNTHELKNLATRLKLQADKDYQEAVELAKANNWTIRKTLEDGRIIQLIRVENNRPVYYTTDNHSAAITTRTDRVHAGGGAGLALEGSNMIVGEWDGGAVLTSHQELNGRITQMDNPENISGHATHVCGTLIASGVHAPAKGMAPQATVQAYDFLNDEGEMAAAAANGLLISNHSYGSVTGWSYSGSDDNGNNLWTWTDGTASFNQNGEDSSFGKYTISTNYWDEIAYDAPHYLIVKSAGNERSSNPGDYPNPLVRNGDSGTYVPYNPAIHPGGDGQIDNGYDCLPTKGVAKNILTVAAVNDVLDYNSANDVGMSTFSSWGPTDDGRIKPDISANGVEVFSLSSNGNMNYNNRSGTSMSAPNVTGSCLLLQEHYENTHGTGNFMRSATLKAVVLHTADEAGPAEGPDYQFGWGLMNTEEAAAVISEDVNNATTINEINLDNGSTFSTDIYSNGAQPLTLTLVWTDPEANAEDATLDSNTPKLVNDLDIRLSDGTTTFMPYILNPANPNNPATTGDNIRDNVEKIYLAAPSAGDYTITVSHKSSLTNGSQDFSLVVTGQGTPSNCQQQEYLALMALYNATDGANWTNPWDLNQPISEWHGVETNGEGCVTELNLYNNQLSGHIPPEIGDLSNLVILRLESNSITGSIPPEIGNLNNLENIQLSSNPLMGNIPPEIGNLSSLSSLLISATQLTGNIPSTIGNLANLQRLELSSNDLTGSIPAEIGNLLNLEVLAFARNRLTGSIPLEIGNLSNLERLNFFANALTGSIPVELSNVTSLKYLSLHRNELNGIIPPELGGLNNLIILNLSENQLNGHIPTELGNLSNLTHLQLNINQLDGTIPVELENLTSLVHLHIFNNDLIGTIPPELGNLSNLSTLRAYTNHLTGTIPPELGNLINLTSLDLSNNQLSGSIPAELDNLINLEVLSFARNQLSGNIPSEIGNLPSLTILRLETNDLTGNIPSELGNLTNLVDLILAKNQLSGIIPAELGNLSNLDYLALNTNQLSGLLPVTLENLTNLTFLSVANNNLEGCFPAEFEVFCSIDYNFSGNPNLPGGGDFEAFCTDATGSCSPFFIIDPICGAQDAKISVPVTIKNFNNITGFQYSIHIPATIGVLGDPYVSNLQLPNLNTGDFTRIDDHTLTVAWEANSIPDGESLVDGDTIFSIEIQVTGAAGATGLPYIDGTPTPIEVVQGFSIVNSETILSEICIFDVFDVEGQVFTIDNEPINNVIMSISGDVNISTSTNHLGTYTFASVSSSSDLTLTPSKNNDVNNGVSIFDVILIKSHLLGITNETFDSPYQYIAADVNGSGTVSLLDIIFIKRVITNHSNSFPIGQSWRFVPADYSFPDAQNPFSFPEERNYMPLIQDHLNEDFIGVKLGDVNNTADSGL